jgi:hypothetical protein
MTEQPASQSTTQALGSTTVVFGWVEESRVQEVLHASGGASDTAGRHACRGGRGQSRPG